jgi:hypothetical protein
MANKFCPTPGPWEVETDNLPYGQITISLEGAPIANVLNVEDFPCIEEECVEHQNEESISNAYLMAAAPDLLDACEAVLNNTLATAFLSPVDLGALQLSVLKAKGEL